MYASAEHGIRARDSGWSDEREPANTLRLFCRQLSRNQAAERMPYEIDPLEFGSVEPTAEPTRQLVGGKPCSEPRQVEQMNAVTLR